MMCFILDFIAIQALRKWRSVIVRVTNIEWESFMIKQLSAGQITQTALTALMDGTFCR